MSNWFGSKNEIRQTAARIAPAIRSMFRSDERYPLVTFSQSSARQKADLVFDAAAYENIEELYASIQASASETSEVSVIEVKGIGSFSLQPSRTRSSKKRLAGKVALVTGGAQGFGEGIARELAQEGAHVVIADLNLELAETVVTGMKAEFGETAALALPVNVGDEESVRILFEETVLSYGGLDLLVSNAGVLKAGGLEEMTLKAFEFVTRINYTAFFLVTKYGVRSMKIQARFDKEYYGDVIQINSKSGLEGSLNNFAYAGSKFGGVGLMQSFAKELVPERIKVNAICPGNYYEGPLWSDPDNGLFVQYLNAGKIPGAKTFEDVYDFYVSKVPMRRGCSPLDVTRAILYCVEQLYETGQAIPVTGGQIMLK